jgi:hypothetical protein
MSTRVVKILCLGLILAHLAVSIFHGAAHQGAMVGLTAFGNLYVLVVITIAPLVAGVLLLTRWARKGALLLALSMLGSFGFGVWYHFLSATTDNVMEVHGPWRSTFFWTAIGLAIIEFAGMLVGVVAAKSLRESAVPLESKD